MRRRWLSASSAGLSAGGGECSPPPQIVFSKTGAFSDTLGPFGFWIWCTPAGSTYGGSTGDCAGSMYFYAFPSLPSGTSPTEAVEGTVQHLASGAYEMTCGTRPARSRSHTLTGPSTPTRGPTNNIDVRCTAPVSASRTATGSVVAVVLF